MIHYQIMMHITKFNFKCGLFLFGVKTWRYKIPEGKETGSCPYRG